MPLFVSARCMQIMNDRVVGVDDAHFMARSGVFTRECEYIYIFICLYAYIEGGMMVAAQKITCSFDSISRRDDDENKRI